MLSDASAVLYRPGTGLAVLVDAGNFYPDGGRAGARAVCASFVAESIKGPLTGVRGPFMEILSGGVLLSHTVSRAVPSAQRGLASGFGMEPGVSL